MNALVVKKVDAKLSERCHHHLDDLGATINTMAR